MNGQSYEFTVRQLMAVAGVRDKATYEHWKERNHPDKGGDARVYMLIHTHYQRHKDGNGDLETQPIPKFRPSDYEQPLTTAGEKAKQFAIGPRQEGYCEHPVKYLNRKDLEFSGIPLHKLINCHRRAREGSRHCHQHRASDDQGEVVRVAEAIRDRTERCFIALFEKRGRAVYARVLHTM